MTAYSNIGVSQGVAEDSGSIMPSGAQLTQLTTHISYTGGGLEGPNISSGALARSVSFYNNVLKKNISKNKPISENCFVQKLLVINY